MHSPLRPVLISVTVALALPSAACELASPSVVYDGVSAIDQLLDHPAIQDAGANTR